jgi:glucokinase
MKFTIALDVGGTHMRIALFPENSLVPVRQTRVRTYSDGTTGWERILPLIEEMTRNGETVDAIGIAVPGSIDPRSGVILTAVNLPEWVGLPIPDLIEEATGIPAFMGNDANLAAIGEWQYGAGQGHQDLIYMTISTGIGGGVISNGHLLEGHLGLAGELGHVTLLPDGPLCNCGQRGHLEALSSGSAISAYVAEQLKAGQPSSVQPGADTRAISLAAKEGDNLAKKAFERAGYYLGLAITNYLLVFNPSIVILGGGVSMTGDLLLDPVRKTVKESVISEHYLQDLVITQAALGDDAGLYGALAFARASLRS